ncbi:MAG: four helix bundle protein [Candidatus Omnitrophica bacterium]|nr:four helix bundle protein [Candidatus Omnitrophota bacterium]
MGFKFENLEVWNKAMDLCYNIHQLTQKFPKEEMYVLTSQIKRAADSIVLNIAEGSTGQSNATFKQFLSYSIRSGIETVACLHIGRKRGLLNQEEFNSLYEDLETIIKMLHGLRKSLK